VKIALGIAALAFAAIAASPVAAQAPRAGHREAAAVRAARSAQNTAILARDFDRVASFWTDDVVVTAGLGRIVQGRPAYRAALSSDSALLFRREPASVDVSDNPRWPVAFEAGTWTGRQTERGEPVVRGRYAAQWVKLDGRWLIHSEVFVALGCASTACSAPLAVRR
jgi:ketosteroid isomerase-like protein